MHYNMTNREPSSNNKNKPIRLSITDLIFSHIGPGGGLNNLVNLWLTFLKQLPYASKVSVFSQTFFTCTVFVRQK